MEGAAHFWKDSVSYYRIYIIYIYIFDDDSIVYGRQAIDFPPRVYCSECASLISMCLMRFLFLFFLYQIHELCWLQTQVQSS